MHAFSDKYQELQSYSQRTTHITYMEGSHSGRVRRLGKAVYPKGYRGFESLTFRQDVTLCPKSALVTHILYSSLFAHQS